ncbi:hypothetical protein VIOR3934_19420 [Vibrio orientalis CIP 102891 = ATCC 33934]|uniref:Uncharacterized protein n=1 Tax=Vibrio orientalis CIP 102891 = ATCC 33934 TaxID=675816 RepID=C9QEE9_VIBOR|nr:hypothetical protein [Vibrio orientalis]EEX94422.1 hypothetical protein VIA_001582 [Vibrio orientalis CIP 102891 = ATCC 33934]EGU54029.1 hypothetical protein VIOR3934_19420 [Vibrio orientalis CIP 102891 = ATCC 33934]
MLSVAKLLLLIIAVGTGFFANDILHWFNAKNDKISLDEYCLITTYACTQDHKTVQADKDTSQPLVPTVVEVDWPESSNEQLLISLQGYEMDMGQVVFKLDKNSDGKFSGQVILPVCTTEAMTWYGTITDGETAFKTSIRMER